MVRLLINIRGANGAGKSTIPMSMRDDPDMHKVGFTIGKRGGIIAPYVTVFPKYGWVALGDYTTFAAGLDKISTVELTKATFDFAWKNFPDYDILMEGAISSTVRSTYINLFKEYQALGERHIIVLNYLPSLEVCIERVAARNRENPKNWNRPVLEWKIKEKWNNVNNNVRHFAEAGITTLVYDNSKITKEEMLPKFFQIADKYRR